MPLSIIHVISIVNNINATRLLLNQVKIYGTLLLFSSGEEVKDPQKAIPISILACLFICFLAYFGISSVLTLMVPYFTLDVQAPLPEAFADVGWVYAKYVIAVGAISGLSSR